ncbi:hypothetical protein [Halobacterium rubrum]|uniref:hypothetical protein n=1 Tax=Halobacterium TaxID=2239 RepID=UPI001F3FD238|nr:MULTISPECIES: hypothetical protein [Halobacterium]MDH5019024.1 hypothetical protein [Halobacterium rubrum]
MTFPAESVPDGVIGAPHHLYIGVLVLAVAILVVADDYAQREPLLALTGTLTALFAFATVWPYYHATGALLTLAGLLVALVGVVWPGGMWSGYPLVWRLVAFVGVLVGLDDAVSHAFGIWTPLDAVWKTGIYPALS